MVGGVTVTRFRFNRASRTTEAAGTIIKVHPLTYCLKNDGRSVEGSLRETWLPDCSFGVV